ncbi:hypothetical protein ACVW16_001236 [Bradyrhizobium sp. USDA 4474]
MSSAKGLSANVISDTPTSMMTFSLCQRFRNWPRRYLAFGSLLAVSGAAAWW